MTYTTIWSTSNGYLKGVSSCYDGASRPQGSGYDYKSGVYVPSGDWESQWYVTEGPHGDIGDCFNTCAYNHDSKGNYYDAAVYNSSNSSCQCLVTNSNSQCSSNLGTCSCTMGSLMCAQSANNCINGATPQCHADSNTSCSCNCSS